MRYLGTDSPSINSSILPSLQFLCYKSFNIRCSGLEIKTLSVTKDILLQGKRDNNENSQVNLYSGNYPRDANI